MIVFYTDKVEVPFEMKLNVSDTQFIVVEDTTSWDTSAVILKVRSPSGICYPEGEVS